MNIIWLILIAAPVFFIGYRFYARFLFRVLSNGEECQTPAVTKNDGNDYVPSRAGVVFGHHFASIAGAGPIIGPTVALIYGYLPVWMWIVLGTVFIGAMQDFSTLFVSMREGGQSMAQVAHRAIGRAGFFLVVAFSIIMLLLLTSAFLKLSVTALTSQVPLSEMNLNEGETFLRITTGADGTKHAHIGGIASMSVIIITLLAPVLGYLNFKRRIAGGWVFTAALVLCAGSVVFGICHPLTLKPDHWMILLAIYVLFASVTPVWILLQPRDFANSFLLYFGMALLLVAVIIGGFEGIGMQMPALNIQGGNNALGTIWPFLFITVACGAISGFHAMVTGGTTCKQIAKEKQALTIGYGGMVMEGVLAILVAIAVGAGLSLVQFERIVFPTVKGAASNPVLAFALGMGGLLNNSIKMPMSWGTVFGLLMVEGFIVTTLDTASRLTRYLLEELWKVVFHTVPALLRSRIFNAALVVAAMYLLCRFNTFLYIWPIFGSANQLMASLALIVVSSWLLLKRRRTWFIIAPAAFMMLTTMVSLASLLMTKYLPAGNYPLIVTDIFMMLLAIGVIILAIRKFIHPVRPQTA